MPSPFSGMDPYLEDPAFWPDFHATLLTYLREILLESLPDQYDARIDEYVQVTSGEPGENGQRIEPDLAVSTSEPKPGRLPHRAAPPGGPVAIVEPVILPFAVEQTTRQRHIRIGHRPGNQLVTVIELLSPSNKEGRGRDSYLFKRSVLLSETVHLVELDLLRRGQRLPMKAPLPAGDYYAFVSREQARYTSEVYAWGLRQPLPGIPIPMREPDPDLWIDLQAVFARTYDRSRYGRVVDYSAAPDPPLSPEDAVWVKGLFAQRPS